MRNHETDSMAAALNQAFEKSAMTLKEFIEHLKATSDIFDYEECEDYVSFHIVKEGEVFQFYFAFDEWYCKQ